MNHTRSTLRSMVGAAALGGLYAGQGVATPVFINEFHYDNAGRDRGEAIEIAGPAGTDLAGWRLELYNGTDGAPYRILTLQGEIPGLENAMGTASFAAPGLQNGAPDGIALVDAAARIVQLLSYEGTFTARSGSAEGLASVDVGVDESAGTPVGASLQLAGRGRLLEDFGWRAGLASTFGAVNEGQMFTRMDAGFQPVPEPASSSLVVVGLTGWAAMGLGLARRRRRPGRAGGYFLNRMVPRPFFWREK